MTDFIFNKQPVMVAALVTWLTGLAATYGLHFDAQGTLLLTGVVGFVVSWIAHSVVWCAHSLDKFKIGRPEI